MLDDVLDWFAKHFPGFPLGLIIGATITLLTCLARGLVPQPRRPDTVPQEPSTRESELQERLTEVSTELAEIKRTQDENELRLLHAAKGYGNLWVAQEKRPHSDRWLKFPKVIAIFNLKGGVGKTTISAHLGKLLSRRFKVLLIDADYQGSLSSRYLTPQQLQGLSPEHHTLAGLFEHSMDTDLLLALSREIAGPTESRIIPSTADLLVAESRAMAHWMVKANGSDIRFCLRDQIHWKEHAKRFDIVIIDCPPRLSTACLNAITAAHKVLIPTIVDNLSTECVPETLRQLQLLEEGGLTHNLEVVGVVPNNLRGGEFLKFQREIWTDVLPAKIRAAWPEPVRLYDDGIPTFGAAAMTKPFPGLCPEYIQAFKDLARSLDPTFVNLD